MYEDHLLAGLRLGPPADRETVLLQMRLPWYRSLPLSCIKRLELEIDGHDQPADHLRVVINGDARSLPEVANMSETWWFVLDAIDLEVRAAPSLSPGAHRVKAGLELRIPYGDPDFRPELNIRQAVSCTRDLTLLGRDE
jgi:hypothetical protein